MNTFFYHRAKYFVESIVGPRFKVKDFWYRFEWQHRGSPHLHGFLWLEGAPNVDSLSINDRDGIDAAILFFDQLVTAMNPNANQQPTVTHPCQVWLFDVTDNNRDLTSIVNRVQRHKCSLGYCQKSTRYDSTPACRFKFPKPFADRSSIELDDHGRLAYNSARNDPWINGYNAFIITLWRANIDIQPITSKHVVVQYIAKYAAKSEPRSEFYKDLLQNILQQQLQPEADGRIAVQKLIIQAISERDISAQECCHLLMSLPLFHSSRTFVVLWFGTKSWDRWLPNTERYDEDLEEADDEEQDNQHSSLIVSYTKRPSEYETMNLLDLCAILYFFKKRWVRRRKAAVVRVLPRFCPDGPAKESFFKQQMMIKMPWRKLEDLNPLNDLWETIYTRHFGSSSTLCEDNSSDTGSSSSDSDANDTQNQFDEWMGLSALGPNGQLQGREPGTRDFDTTFNWKATYPSYHSFRDVRSFITTCKETHVNLPIQRTDVSIHFSLEQQKFIDLFQLQLAQLSSASNENPTSIHRVMVQGTAGTGKSTLIKHISTTLTATLGNSSFMLLAPTGVAAYNVGGTTIHSALRIPIERKYFSQLSSAAKHDLQSQFQSCHFVIIDEFSMVGCALLSVIDKRLR